MSIKYKYRFKTENEFIEEFGCNWRSEVSFTHTGEMDYLCGNILKLNVTKDDFTERYLDSFWLRFKYDGWFISMKMITLTKQVPDYNPRKFIREI